MNKAYNCRIDALNADDATETWYTNQVGFAIPACADLYKES